MGGPVRVQLDHDLVGRDVVTGDRAGALWSLNRSADARRVFTEVLIQGMLVLQAAHQTAAGPGDAPRVDRQVLLFGHPDRDRLEVFEEGGAAQVAAARADATLQPGFVTGADLPELHPAPELTGQVADQGPEVNQECGEEGARAGIAGG